MSYKYPFFVLITGMIVASVIPFGMSQTPEDAFMEIDMLVGQTENPFRIQDENDIDIFSIDNTGHVSPDHDWKQLDYSFSNEIHFTNSTHKFSDLPTDKTLNDSVLAQWDITSPVPDYVGNAELDYYLINDIGWIYAGMKEGVVGTGACVFEFARYDANNGWQTNEDAVSGATSYQLRNGFWAEDSRLGVESIRVAFWQSDELQDCYLKEGYFEMDVFIPDNWTLTRIK